MRSDLTAALKARAVEVANIFSDPERKCNFSKETFRVKEIIPLSESTAAVVFQKNTQKLALCFFYYIGPAKQWNYFFPTDSHILGMSEVGKVLVRVEKYNFNING